MLSSVEELGEIDRQIEEVNEKRSELAGQLQLQTQQEEELLTQLDAVNEQLGEVAEEVGRARTCADVEQLRIKYGPLAVLAQLEQLFRERDARAGAVQAADALQRAMDVLSKLETRTYTLESLQELRELHSTIRDVAAQVPDEEATARAYARFNALVERIGRESAQIFEKELLAAKWDTQQFVRTESAMQHLRELSSSLYSLNELLLPHADSDAMWNFDCMANNFKIKFIYHFNGSSMQQTQSIEMYFQFLDKYLDQNLCKCIEIFQDEKAGVTPGLVHRQFINRVLEPIRHKVNSTMVKTAQTLSKEGLNTMLVLISQVFINDNALLKKHYYDGVGLVSMIPNQILDKWLAFETDSTTAQYSKICNGPLNRNGFDLQKLLLNLYEYFEPFYNLDYDRLMDYKFKITKEIFMDLPSNYRKYILTHGDDRAPSYIDESQLEQTLWKLHNLVLIQQLLQEFENKFNFINLTLYFNDLTSSSYSTVLSDVLGSYEEAIVTLRESVIHRIKKMLSSTLRVYFKVNDWSTITSEPEQCSSELVGAVNLLKKIFIIMTQFDLTVDIPLIIKNEVLNIIIHFMVDYVVNLNKFSEMGLQQLLIDYDSLKETLNFEVEQDPQNAEEAAFFETIAILKLKHQAPNTATKFMTKEYVEKRDFAEFRSALNIIYSTDSEISSALYRVL